MSAKANHRYVQPCIPKFDGDYDHWSLVMDNHLRSKEFWGVVESCYIMPEKEEGIFSWREEGPIRGN